MALGGRVAEAIIFDRVTTGMSATPLTICHKSAT